MDTTIGKVLLYDEQQSLEADFKSISSRASGNESPELSAQIQKDVYFQKLKFDSYNKRICRIHFYYFKIKNDKLIARHYKYDERHADLDRWTNFRHEIIHPPGDHLAPSKSITDALEYLLENARKSNLNNQDPRPTPDVRAVDFQERSFLAFCFDHDGWTFPEDPRLGGGDPALPAVFFTENGQLTPNHSFFDGRTAVDIVGGGEPRPVFYMVNHAKRNANDDDLVGGDSQPIKFNVVVQVPVGSSGNHKLTVIFDPGGNNLGPPQPPY